jgi:hypothetical protein
MSVSITPARAKRALISMGRPLASALARLAR